MYAAVSLLTLALAAAVIWDVRIDGSLLAFGGSWFLAVASTLSIGLMVGGVAKDAKQASMIACILYFPMLIFSGATLPLEVMPEAMQNVVRLFPLTQGIQLMKATFLGSPVQVGLLPVLVMLGVTVVCALVAIRYFRWE